MYASKTAKSRHTVTLPQRFQTSIMPRQFVPLTSERMSTRASNKDAHPGIPDMPAPRRTPAEVEEAREAAAAKVAEAADRQEKALEKLAALEDQQRREDQRLDREREKDLESSSK
jgi:hypothetical protein